MLAIARGRLPAARVEAWLERSLEDELPAGPFELVVSALAVHHLDAAAKRDLFRRIHAALQARGRFVLADVVVPVRAEDAVIPLTPAHDLPDSVADQVEWLQDAGFAATPTWSRRDLAVIAATRL